MHASLPPLAWLDDFCLSMMAATGEGLRHSESDTGEENVKEVVFQFQSHMTIKSIRLISELLHSWAKANECGTIGRVKRDGTKMIAKIVIKHQFGNLKIRHPLGDKK